MRLCRAGDRSVAEVASELDLTETALREWVKRAEVGRRQGAAGGADDGGARGADASCGASEAPRDGARHLKKSGGLLREGERVKFAFIARGEGGLPGRGACAACSGSRAAATTPGRRALPLERSKEDAQLAAEIAAAHTAQPRRRTAARAFTASCARKGIRVGKKRVERLMREKGIVGAQKRRFVRTTDSNHDDPIAPNVARTPGSRPSAPNEAWVDRRDLHRDGRGVAVPGRHPRPVLAPRRRLGGERHQRHERSPSPRSTTRSRARARCRARPPLRSRQPLRQRRLPHAPSPRRGIVASMSRKGDCWDNAVAESFFATLKGELVDHERYPTRGGRERVDRRLHRRASTTPIGATRTSTTSARSSSN